MGVRGSFSRCPGCGAALTRNGPPGLVSFSVFSVRGASAPLPCPGSNSTAPERPGGPPWGKTGESNLQAAARPRFFMGPRLFEPAAWTACKRTKNGNVRSSSMVRRHCAAAPPGEIGAESKLRIRLSRKYRRGPDELRGPAGFAAFAETKADKAVTIFIKYRNHQKFLWTALK